MNSLSNTLLLRLLFASFLIVFSQSLKAQQIDANWEKLQHESEGGIVDDVVSVNGKLYMSYYNELFMSADGGASWSYVLTKGPLGVAYGGSPNDTFGSDRKLIVSGDSILFGDQISINGGATWKTWAIDASTLPTSYYFHPTVMHTHNAKLYLGTLIQGMFMSNDLGKTFVNMNAGYPMESYGYYYQTPMSIEFYNGQPVVATLSGLYRWNGSTWTHPAGNGLPTTIINPETSYPITSYLIDRIRFLGSMWLVSTNFGIYYSNDQGNNWQRFHGVPPLTGLGNWYGYSSPPVFYNLDVENGNIMVSYENEIYISANGGSTWKHSSLPEKTESKRMVSIGGNFLVATAAGIYRSNDGGSSWQKSNTGFERVAFAIYEKNGEGFLSSSTGVLKSTGRGKTLTPFNNGIDLLNYVGVRAISSDEVIATRVRNNYYAGTLRSVNYQSYRSTLDVPQWNAVTTLPVDQIGKMEISPDGTYIVTGSVPLPGGKQDWTGIHLSNDKGQSWKKVFVNVTNNTKHEDHVSSILFDSDTIYAGTIYSGVYKSSDKGYSWTSISRGIHLPDLSDNTWWQDTTVIEHISLIKRFKKELYCIGENSFSGYSTLYHSSDGGKHWSKKNFSSAGPNYALGVITSLSITETGNLIARVATNYFKNYTLLISEDHGNTWKPCGPDFPGGQRIFSTGVLGDYVYASGNKGLWRLKLPRGLSIYAEAKNGHKGTQVVVPIKADQFDNLVSGQFTIAWNNSVATFAGVEQFGIPTINNSSFGLTQTAIGKLTFSWSSPDVQPQHLPDSSVLFAIRFNLIGNYGDTTNLRITNDPVTVEFADANLQLVSALTYPAVVKINSSAVIQGKVLYSNNEAVKNVTLELVNSNSQSTQTTTTDDKGEYSFAVSLHDTDDTLILTPSKSPDPEPLNGIDVRDIAAMRRHILGTALLSTPYQVIAADVNRSQRVTTLDIVLEQALILGTIDNFPGNSQWTFVDAATVFPKPELPFPYTSNTTLSSQPDTWNVNFKAIKLGDVDGSRDNSQQGRVGEQEQIIFVLSEENRSSDFIDVPVKVKRFNDVSGYQFTISWDQDQLEYVGAINKITNGRFGEHRATEGMLTTVWDDENGKSQTLVDQSELFRLQFRKVNASATVERVNITSAATNALVYNSNLKLVPHLVEYTRAETDPEVFQLHQNFPNAFDDKTSIGFTVPKSGNVQIDILDIKGSLIRRATGFFERGIHVIDWDGTDKHGGEVQSGIYVCKASYGKVSVLIKMVKK